MKTVHVLLSAYNGERYIREQIDSILAQTYPEVELYVRDDGSKDGTPGILKEYEDKGQICLECGQNVGFVKSFQWLIANGGEADYYAFCDQDDVWFPEKIAMAVEVLEEAVSKGNHVIWKQKGVANHERCPILYFSNYDYYDGDMNFMGHHDAGNPNVSFVNSLVDCVPLGFNTVFNRTARDMITREMPKRSTGHDWWLYMLCAGLGEIVYDRRPTVKYRRHNSNVSDKGDSFLAFQIWRFKRFFVNHYFHHIHEQIKEFSEIYYNRLSDENQKILDLFTKDGCHPVNSLKKVFYPQKLRQGKVDEMFLRLVFLIGRL